MYTTGAAVFPRAGARRAAPNKNSRGSCKTRPEKLERVRRASCGRAARATWVSSHCVPGVWELGWGSRRGGSASWKRGALVITRNRAHHKALFGRRGDAAELSSAGCSCSDGPSRALGNVKFAPGSENLALQIGKNSAREFKNAAREFKNAARESTKTLRANPQKRCARI